MVPYSIAVLFLINRPKAAYPGFRQPWYADNAGANIELYFNSLKQFGRVMDIILNFRKEI